jgi:RNA polymerase sigma-70 factor (ECF subfamily)
VRSKNEEYDRTLERFRAHLSTLARLHVDPRLQGKNDLSGVVQQTLQEAHQAFVQLRGKSEAEQAAWLRRALAHNLADEVRRLTRGKRDLSRERSLENALNDSSARLDAWLAAERALSSREAERQEQALLLAEALDRLPDSQRRAVELRHLHGLSLPEVAAELGCSRPAVVGLLSRGMKGLRKALHAGEGDA